jgi:hypothetical protein
MKIKTADDVQLLVEDFGWLRDHSLEEIRNLLKEMNATEHRKTARLINDRVWDETLSDEMAVSSRYEAAKRFTDEDKAIDLWYERESNAGKS